MHTVDLDKEYIAATYGRREIVFESGKGSLLYDENGKEYIDMASGIAVNTFGVGDEDWINAVNAQLNKLQHTSNYFYTEPASKLAKLLSEKSGMKKVFFSNSGAEANECAIKTARKYSAEKYDVNRYKIITLKNSFHGRTMATLSATGQDVFHADFTPMLDGFYYCEAGNNEQLKELVNKGDVCGIMFEIVQGEGGVLPLSAEFLNEIKDIANKEDILLIADEVQCGNGRTGKYFGYQNFDIIPDIVTTAKGLGGGLPIGATLFGDKTKDVLTKGKHGSTFGGNPVSCAGAVNIVNRIDDELLNEVSAKSQYIFEALQNSEGVISVTGLGLMIGIETEKNADEIVKKCEENGVIVITAKNKVRLLPPLNIDWDLLEKAVGVIIDACKE